MCCAWRYPPRNTTVMVERLAARDMLHDVSSCAGDEQKIQSIRDVCCQRVQGLSCPLNPKTLGMVSGQFPSHLIYICYFHQQQRDQPTPQINMLRETSQPVACSVRVFEFHVYCDQQRRYVNTRQTLEGRPGANQYKVTVQAITLSLCGVPQDVPCLKKQSICLVT